MNRGHALRLHQIAAATIGNATGWYDFMIFGCLTVLAVWIRKYVEDPDIYVRAWARLSNCKFCTLVI